MANFGTSSRIRIGGQNFQARQGMIISPILNDSFQSVPPSPNDGTPSPAMYAYQNHDKDFIFQKICPPLYKINDGDISEITGLPINEPDFIADFHFIGLMRAIDDMCRHRYSGYIGGSTDGPTPT